MAWTFHCPTRIVAGAGVLAELGRLAAEGPGAAVLVTGGSHLEESGVLAAIEASLGAAGVELRGRLRVAGEPDDRLIDRLADELRALDPDQVIAVGGGSALDAGKALAALARNPGSVLDYLEGIPDRETAPLARTPLKVIAVPTTAGTGSEVTRNAVIGASAHGVKRSLRDPRLIPAVAVVDPELLAGCPKAVAAAAGMDALAHLAESFLSTGATPVTDVLAEAGLERALRYLQQLVADAVEPTALMGISEAALWGGLCLAHARLGAAHGLVAPLGGSLPVPHGAGIAALSGPALTVTDQAVQTRAAPEDPVHHRLARLSAIIAGPGSTASLAAAKLDRLRQELELPGLAHYGLTTETIPGIAAQPSSSIRSHPIQLTAEELHEILERAL